MASCVCRYDWRMWRWMQEHQVLALGFIAAAIFALWELRFVAAVGLVGYIVAAALLPVVDWLHRRNIPRAIGILGVYLALIAAAAAVFGYASYAIFQEWDELLAALTYALSKFLGAGSLVQQFGLRAEDVIGFVERAIVPVTTSAIAIAAGIASVLVISAYALYDWHESKRKLLDHQGGAWRRLGQMLANAETDLGAWVRGQLFLSVLVGALVYIALFFIGLPFAPLLGVWAGLCELIPYAGPFLAGAPAVLLAFSISPMEALIVVGAYFVIQQIENHALVPLVMKNVLRLHPVVIILSILAGFEILGVLGALLAVPVVSLLRIAVLGLGGSSASRESAA